MSRIKSILFFCRKGMSNSISFEEQPPESPLDVLSRVATMVEKSQTSPAAAAAPLNSASTEQPAGPKMLHQASSIVNTDHNNELNSAHSPPPTSEMQQHIQSKSKLQQ